MMRHTAGTPPPSALQLWLSLGMVCFLLQSHALYSSIVHKLLDTVPRYNGCSIQGTVEGHTADLHCCGLPFVTYLLMASTKKRTGVFAACGLQLEHMRLMVESVYDGDMSIIIQPSSALPLVPSVTGSASAH